jgi:hypothetical protein
LTFVAGYIGTITTDFDDSDYAEFLSNDLQALEEEERERERCLSLKKTIANIV